jgi:TM2 domain-containing membrane protein YozV
LQNNQRKIFINVLDCGLRRGKGKIMIIITTIMIGVICLIWGAVWERYRWVKAAKNDKVIAVEGNLYRVTKTSENAG